MKETIKLGFILLLITAVSGGVLAFSNSITAPIIEEIERQGSFGALTEIFPDAEDFQEIDEDKLEEVMADNKYVIEVHEAIVGDDIVGYTIKTISSGYGGELPVITGINLDGTIAGIRVLENSETPNLGTKVEEPNFTEGFIGKGTSEEIVGVKDPSGDNEIQGITGATVSVTGVLTGVNGAREAFLEFFSN